MSVGHQTAGETVRTITWTYVHAWAHQKRIVGLLQLQAAVGFGTLGPIVIATYL
jgi:hypothetical protein